MSPLFQVYSSLIAIQQSWAPVFFNGGVLRDFAAGHNVLGGDLAELRGLGFSFPPPKSTPSN